MRLSNPMKIRRIKWKSKEASGKVKVVDFHWDWSKSDFKIALTPLYLSCQMRSIGKWVKLWISRIGRGACCILYISYIAQIVTSCEYLEFKRHSMHISHLGQVKGVELPVFGLFKGHHLKTKSSPKRALLVKDPKFLILFIMTSRYIVNYDLNIYC